MIAVVVVSYRKTGLTLECLESLYAHAGAPFHLVLVDNASSTESRSALSAFLRGRDDATLIVNVRNEGFAVGCNQAIDLALSRPGCQAVALLNNDAVVEPGWLAEMAAHLDPASGCEMVAARMMQFDDPSQVDSLGIVFYKSGIASNRKQLAQPLLGPCGGAALYSSGLLRRLRDEAGYLFDPSFFCYAEDTDLALRARALGYQCAFADGAVVRHRGSASTGGGYNELIAYYGLRNSLLALVKNLPRGFLVRNLAWLISMQGAVVVKYLVKGKPRLLWRVYRDAWRGLAKAIEHRRHASERYPAYETAWRDYVSRDFYDRAYVVAGAKSLLARDIKSADG